LRAALLAHRQKTAAVNAVARETRAA
jgi:hypothetical protein